MSGGKVWWECVGDERDLTDPGTLYPLPKESVLAYDAESAACNYVTDLAERKKVTDGAVVIVRITECAKPPVDITYQVRARRIWRTDVEKVRP